MLRNINFRKLDNEGNIKRSDNIDQNFQVKQIQMFFKGKAKPVHPNKMSKLLTNAGQIKLNF